ncbi:MAG: peptide ABC transporter substrate-binding protein [Akkermansiaceae bacterium]|nr:peptide ABC transporter substrate-binding protein [Akkermansiaceae bacterium]
MVGAVTFRSYLLILFPFWFLLTCCQKESEVDRANREGILLIGNSSEPKGLDPHIVSGVLESNILRALFEGLITSDPKSDTATPGGAASEVTPDATATVWTAKLRPNGKWSDGMPVTASDFAFSYERLLTPELGAQYAEMLYFLKGAEEFNKGKTKDFSTVGVQVIDDLTLQLTLRGPTPYFREILKHYTWTAVPRHVVLKHGSIGQRGNPWTRKENIVCNGPYRLKSWRRTDHIEVERNPFYWNAANVTLNGIRFLPITNLYTEARMFRDGQLHMTYAATSEVVDMMKATNPSALRQEPYVGTGFFRFNTTRKPLNDLRVRKALSLAIDRAAICNTVFRGYTPAYAMTPPMGDYKPPQLLGFDRVLAKRLLDEAGYPGGKGFPRLKVLIASKETAATLAQAVQAMWRDTLGIEVEIENKEWNAYLVAMQELDYDIANAGWVGDYLDPLTFLEMWTPGNGNNLTGWKSPEFVKLLQQSFQETDPTRRLENLYQAETILVNEAPIALIAWQARNYLIHPSLEGWHPLLLSNNPYQFLRLVPGR